MTRIPCGVAMQLIEQEASLKRLVIQLDELRCKRRELRKSPNRFVGAETRRW
jgi:hypothetical protein